jgi:hypothetical protein
MPKLDTKTAAATAEQESQSFEALPARIYPVVLRSVEVRASKKDQSPYWVWELEVCDDDEHKGRKLWSNTSLKENALWKLNEVFTAFGYTTDSDTDEIVGEKCRIAVSQRLIEQGSRSGEMGNNIDKHLPYGDGGGAEDGDDEVF